MAVSRALTVSLALLLVVALKRARENSTPTGMPFTKPRFFDKQAVTKALGQTPRLLK